MNTFVEGVLVKKHYSEISWKRDLACMAAKEKYASQNLNQENFKYHNNVLEM